MVSYIGFSFLSCLVYNYYLCMYWLNVLRKKGNGCLSHSKKSMLVRAKKSHLLIILLTDFSDIITLSKIIHSNVVYQYFLLLNYSYISIWCLQWYFFQNKTPQEKYEVFFNIKHFGYRYMYMTTCKKFYIQGTFIIILTMQLFITLSLFFSSFSASICWY